MLERRKEVLVCICLILSVFLLYWQIHSHDFVLIDDNVYVTENPYVKSGISLYNIQWAFTTFTAEFWHPVTWLSLMLDTSLYGVNPWGYHFTNILIHALNSILLFLLFNQLTSAPWKSAFTAAFFALHPINVEPVSWISSRKDVLGAFFTLLSLSAYFHYCSKEKRIFYVLSVFAFGVSLMAKSIFVTIPFLMLLMDYWPLGRLKCSKPGRFPKISYKRALREKAPFLLLSLSAGILTIWAQKEGGGLISLSDFPLSDRLINAAVMYPAYLEKLFLPINLSCIYPFKTDPSPWKAALSIILLTGIFAAVLFVHRNHGYAVSGWLWFFITLLPVSGLMKVGDFFIADRYAYFSFIGMYILLIWSAGTFVQRLKIPVFFSLSFFVAIVVLLSAISYKQIGYWKNSTTLFTHAVRVTKDNHLAHSALGLAFARRNDLEKAISHFQEAVRLKPKRVQYRLNLGRALVATGRFEKAVPVLQGAIDRFPLFPEPYYYLGLSMAALGAINQALENFYHAFQRHGNRYGTVPASNDPKVLYRLAESYLNQKKDAKALSLFHIKISHEWLKKAAQKGYTRWSLLKS